MFPSDYGRVIQALAELMKERGDWTPEVAFFARFFCKATGVRATLPDIEMVQAQDIKAAQDTT
jgi:hypothetical protein